MGVPVLVLLGIALCSASSADEHPDRVRAVVDVTRGVSGLSPLLYGQFIEHMGRSIYGGLWAEMLQDRKFFHPVGGVRAPGSGRSPWVAAGGSVRMDEKNPYVGRHSVLMTAPAGGVCVIRHGGLGLTRDAWYTGYVVAKTQPAAAAFLEASLAWGSGEENRRSVTLAIPSRWKKIPFRLSSGACTDKGVLALSLKKGSVWIGAVSLMPVDNVEGFRADTLFSLRALGATIYRWPGGNFVSGYKWWEGIGDRDRRAPFKNPAWPGFDQNDVGIDEFLRFVELVGAQPYVVVNAGLGTAEMAAALVEYTNGEAGTKWGARRVQNGRAKPYGVTWWGIGNEMYGSWQLGHVPVEQYSRRHRAFAEAMRRVDPSIRIVAVGASGAWSRYMLKSAADTMNLLSEHFYCAPEKDLLRHVASMRNAVREKARRHREACRAVFGSDVIKVPVALDEWNYHWRGKPHVYGMYGIPYTWRDGLGVAAGLCELIRHRRVFHMAAFAQAVNVIGAVKTTKRACALETSALPLLLFRHQFGSIGLKVEGHTEPLDVVAALTKDRSALAVACVNPTDRWKTLQLELLGAAVGAEAELFCAAHPDQYASNSPPLGEAPESFKVPRVVIERFPVRGCDPRNLGVAPLSVSLWRFSLHEKAERTGTLFEGLRKPEETEELVLVYSSGKELRGAVSADGLTFKPVGTLLSHTQLKRAGVPEGSCHFSVSALPEGLSVVLSTGSTPLLYVVGEKTPREVSVRHGEGLSAARIFYDEASQSYFLLATQRTADSPAMAVSARSTSPVSFPAPEPVLSRSYAVGAGPLLQGKESVMFFSDSRVETCRLAVSQRPGGPYFVLSPPLGRYKTSCPGAFVTQREVYLYLREAEGGIEVLRTENLSSWEEVPAGEVSLPGDLAGAWDFLWVKKTDRRKLFGEAR